MIFTSDNGAPVNYPEDGDTFHHRPNGPWRGQKADIWEAGHRIPLIITGPGVRRGADCAAHRVADGPVPHPARAWRPVDGRTPPPEMSSTGRSFAVLLADPDATADPTRIFGLQALNGMLALRYGSRKAVLGTGSGGFTELKGEPSFDRDSAGQLFDLADDPGEQRNRWLRSPDEAWRVFDAFAAASGFDVGIDAPRPPT